MKKLLYVKHAFHNKTKSNDFLQEIIKTGYEIEFFDYDNDNDTPEKFRELEGKEFDTVVLFQIMPPISELKKYIKYKHISFFPMYDATHFFNRAIWNEYRDCNIINFSSTLHQKCKSLGLSSYYIQYFPKPAVIDNYGEEDAVFFWQRREKINTKTIEKVLNASEINKLYLHAAPDPENKVPEPSKKWEGKIVNSSWFETKEEMQNYIQKAALYFAPREFEGIGMSFLEAMAAGRCVIAPDNPTMNEYIKNGETGYLYNLKSPKRIKPVCVKEIQNASYKYISEGYQKWEEQKFEILKWLETPPNKNSNTELMNEKLLIKNPQKTFCCKIYTTTNSTTYKIFNIIPLKIKRSINACKR